MCCNNQKNLSSFTHAYLNCFHICKVNKKIFLGEFFQRSFGAQFLFKPNTYRKGNVSREAADLAWINSDLVVLFYFKPSKKYNNKTLVE